MIAGIAPARRGQLRTPAGLATLGPFFAVRSTRVAGSALTGGSVTHRMTDAGTQMEACRGVALLRYSGVDKNSHIPPA
jgi:hypothetical protein